MNKHNEVKRKVAFCDREHTLLYIYIEANRYDDDNDEQIMNWLSWQRRKEKKLSIMHTINDHY